jgi:pimeloyl-ACP methyl ester carboxylesterase
VLPGKHELDDLDGACSVSGPPETFARPGPSRSGSFFSHARNREVGYTIAYPPGHGPGSRLPLRIVLRGFGGDHRSGLGNVSIAQALAVSSRGTTLPPLALVAADGGGLYWNPHPEDDPLEMLVEELLPMCRRLGLGSGADPVGAIGVSMGGYGALLLAERHPRMIAAVAAISPAVFTTYGDARGSNAGAFASAVDFASDDVVTHAAALARTPVRIAPGVDDPFHPGVVALARALPPTAEVTITKGCHDVAFTDSQRTPSLMFLARHLLTPAFRRRARDAGGRLRTRH